MMTVRYTVTDGAKYWDEIKRRAFTTSYNNGFHDDDTLKPDIMSLQISRRLMLIAGEAVEAHDWLHRGKGINEIWWEKEGTKPEGIPIELADIIIRLCDTAALYGIDLHEAIEMKMAYNNTREWRHGKAF